MSDEREDDDAEAGTESESESGSVAESGPDAESDSESGSDSEPDPEPEPESDNDTDEDEGRDKTGVGREAAAASPPNRIVAWVLPPLLAFGAVGLHFWLNVPDEPVVQHPKDQKAEAAKRRAERAKKRREKRMHKPRPGAELDALLEQYDGTDFEKEPVVGKWARQTQTMLNKAIVMSRKAAFDGAPEEPRVSVVRTQCRTIRCRMLLKSPYVHEVEMLADTLKRVETLAGESIWLRYEVEPVDAPKPGKKKGDDEKDGEQDQDTYLQVTVVMIADNIEGNELALAEPPDKEKK